jgi:hypothetical protein
MEQSNMEQQQNYNRFGVDLLKIRVTTCNC